MEQLLVALVDASQCVQLQQSVKLAKALINLLTAYQSSVKPHFGTILMKAANSNTSFMSKTLKQKALSLLSGADQQ